MRTLFISCFLFLLTHSVFADTIFKEPKQFIDEAFQQKVPKPKVIWLTKKLKFPIKKILNHKYRTLRVRYWGQQNKTAWILEETGKEEPITVGIIISNNHIEKVQILIYRESRGGEVRYPFFTSQFNKTHLTNDHKLDKHIDGITGATLSVNAIKKLSRLALFLHQQTPFSKNH